MAAPLSCRCRRSGFSAAAAAVLLLAALLGALPSSHACDDPFTYSYLKSNYSSPTDGRTYTLFGIYTASGCLNDFFTAKAICEKQGLELAPEGEEASLAALRHLCAGRRFTCWMDGKLEPGFCYLMSQEGNIHKQGCYQPVRFVCRDKAATPPGVLYLSKDGYDYRMYTTDATKRTSYSGAVTFCQGLGEGWDLVTYWDDSNGYAAVHDLCAKQGFTCWLKRKDTDSLCPLMAADGSLQMQGCEQDVRFVCRKASSG